MKIPVTAYEQIKELTLDDVGLWYVSPQETWHLIVNIGGEAYIKSVI